MESRTWTLLTALGLAVLAAAETCAQNAQPPAGQEGVEVMARGPVHEAFAEPSQARPLPSSVVPKPPPAPIEEMPPNEKPTGDHVIWIPGYWAWDDETQDYLWVSGFWRVPPPDRQWTPGNWQQVDGGWQWTSGFWAPTNLQQMNYLPPPPPSVDAGPSTPAPAADSSYVPGCWVYQGARYLWRPGFWVGFQPGWVWVPCQYVWTPSGYVFVDGFWDRPLENRGLLFAPIRLAPGLLTVQWTYTPRYVVQQDFLFGALFARPSYCHYYFGDYFQADYGRRGFIPWFDYRVGRGGYDPNFAYYRHRFGDHGWERNLRGYYAGRTSGAIPRPPRTLVQQNTIVNNINRTKIENVNIHKNINITHIQNSNALVPVTKIHNTRVTGLSSLNPHQVAANRANVHVIQMQAMTREQQAQARNALAQLHEAGQRRRLAEAKLLAGHAPPIRATDPPRVVHVQPIKVVPLPPNAPKPAVAPPPPRLPPHVEKAIPPHQPPKPAKPPKK